MANQEIWVFSEQAPLLAELIGAARAINADGQISALVLGPREAAQAAIDRGADCAYWLGELKEHALVDDYLLTIARLVEERQPAILLVGSTRRGRAIAGRLAARMGITALTDVLHFQPEGEALQIRHLLFGGGAVRVERPLTRQTLATVGPGVFDPAPAQPGRSGEIIEVAFVEPEWRATLRERKTRPPVTVDLTKARKVVCAGRGVAKQEDLSLVNELAQALGAEIACTRPLAEGLGWLPVERYLGISGATVRPDLYLGLGVSGQVQHLIGMNHSRVVVAINKDKNAPIFAQADYGIASDLYAVVPALIKAIKERG